MKLSLVLIAAAAGVSAITTTLPKSAGATAVPTAIPVKGSYDGKMKRFERSPSTCQGQSETGEKDASFILEDGAVLSNVIIGASSGEGVHCKGSCTLNNVWWADVCEDAATFKMSSGTATVNGGGAFKAADKVFQFNGKGTLNIKDFFVKDYGKLVRSCGNCKNNVGPRIINISGAIAKSGGDLCGVNENYGDRCTITNTCQDKGKNCVRYQGNSSGKEPTKLGSGHDGKTCILKDFKTC
ncbi:pectate lyase [Stachybotrys elegans]|uniref:Pectate lyase n=1 Tax=Stachybotrys elegans TaxID=80388 RepID=A0A8K0SJL5_9HYPO|nr:pectate lyase [Stachybotrys elegans]